MYISQHIFLRPTKNVFFWSRGLYWDLQFIELGSLNKLLLWGCVLPLVWRMKPLPRGSWQVGSPQEHCQSLVATVVIPRRLTEILVKVFRFLQDTLPASVCVCVCVCEWFFFFFSISHMCQENFWDHFCALPCHSAYIWTLWISHCFLTFRFLGFWGESQLF